MTETTPRNVAKRSQPRTRPSIPAWPAYAAAVWSGLFAALSFFWAICLSLGVNGGAELVGQKFVELAAERDPSFIATMWLTAVAKLLGAIFALTLVRPWGRALPVRLRCVLAWAGGIGLTFYGAANFIEHGLMQADAIAVPAGLGEKALPWHLLVWDPIWLLGGVLFLLAARAFRGPE